MEIKILFFAALRERMNTSEKIVDLPENETADGAARRVVGFNDCLAFAVNDEMVERGYVLKPGDTLALIPPMAGG